MTTTFGLSNLEGLQIGYEFKTEESKEVSSFLIGQNFEGLAPFVKSAPNLRVSHTLGKIELACRYVSSSGITKAKEILLGAPKDPVVVSSPSVEE